jgi:hypothetical protein
MGREIRRVPPRWDHPTIDHYGRAEFQPMYDKTLADAMGEWLADFDRIRAGGMTDDEREYYPLGLADWMADYPPPAPSYYRPWADADATWLQVWETVSEGTPVSPPFATKEELAAYLAANGDFWDQKRRGGKAGWGKASADAFVGAGWAPSLAVIGGRVVESKGVAAALSEGE